MSQVRFSHSALEFHLMLIDEVPVSEALSDVLGLSQAEVWDIMGSDPSWKWVEVYENELKAGGYTVEFREIPVWYVPAIAVDENGVALPDDDQPGIEYDDEWIDDQDDPYAYSADEQESLDAMQSTADIGMAIARIITGPSYDAARWLCSIQADNSTVVTRPVLLPGGDQYQVTFETLAGEFVTINVSIETPTRPIGEPSYEPTPDRVALQESGYAWRSHVGLDD